MPSCCTLLSSLPHPLHLPFFLFSASLYPSVGQRDILVLGFVSFPDAVSNNVLKLLEKGTRVQGYSHLPSGKDEVEAGRGKSLPAQTDTGTDSS